MTKEELQTKCVYIKFINNEQVMAIQNSITEDYVEFVFPMEIYKKIEESKDGFSEKMYAMPYCKYIQGRTFRFPMEKIFILEPLSKDLIPYFVGLLDKYELKNKLPSLVVEKKETSEETYIDTDEELEELISDKRVLH